MKPIHQWTLVLLTAFAASKGYGEYQHSVEPYDFENRAGEVVKAEKGTFYVPSNRRTGNDDTIALRYVRFPATTDKPGAPIVYLAGGPGGSGSGTATGSRFGLFMKMRELGDVIAFDQRGTGLSDRPPACEHEWSIPLDQAATRAAATKAIQQALKACVRDWNQAGVDLNAYNTEESADDLEALREVLGAKKLRLWSISYGTHLAMTFMRRHPNSVESAVLAGLEGPDDTVKPPSQQQALLEHIAELVNADPVAKERYPDFLGALERVLERAKKSPIKATAINPQNGQPGPVLITAFDLQRLVAATLRGPSDFRMLPAAVTMMDAGDFSLVAQYLPFVRSGDFSAMSDAMDVASGISDQRLQRVKQEAQKTLLGDAINFPYLEMREVLGVRDLGDAFRAPLKTDIPILVISGTADGRTPPENGEIALQHLSNGHHLVIEGAGHSDPLFLSSPKIAEAMMQLYRGESVDTALIKLEPVDLTNLQLH